MNIVKRIIRYGVISLALSFAAFLLYGVYVESPSEVRLQIADTPSKALSELLAIAEKGTPINPDPYAASTYQPDDVLFPAMVLIQQNYRWDAKQLLRVLARQGNADALFWMGELTYRSSPFSGGEGAEYFQQAAGLGNPYAALMLDKDSWECKKRMAPYCDAKWGKLGRKILRERAAQGDAKAGYALYLSMQYEKPGVGYLFNRDDYIAEGQGPFQVLLKAAKDGVKQHYYLPLRKLFRLYKFRSSLIPMIDSDVPLTEVEKATLFKVMEIAGNNNDIELIARIRWMPGGWPLAVGGWQLAAAGRNVDFIDYSRNLFAFEVYALMAVNNRTDAVRGYARALTFAEQDSRNIYYESRYENYLKDVDVPLLSDKEKAQAQVLAKQYLKTNAPIIYIDENNKL